MTRKQDITVVIPMYRTGALTAVLVETLFRCRLPETCRLGAIVVDDASGDGSSARVQDLGILGVRVLTLPRNMGRSAARNMGAREAPDGLLLFLDSDCIPSDEAFLESHLATLQGGADVSMGVVTGASDGFWHAYQAAAMHRRLRASVRQGVAIFGSSQNFMVRRQLFIELGGFDEGYKGYGFEDRDLFLRMAEHGRSIAWTPLATVIHRDRLGLRRVCAKMAEAGGAPAMRFSERHPEAYLALGYGKLDARRRRWLRLIEPISSMVTHLLIRALDSRLETLPLPLAWRLAMVRAMVAACYLRGTVAEGRLGVST
jgi:GT2 family glycosyltransferase